MYSAIEALAVAVADRETAQLARGILRDERRMLAFLEREIPRLTGAVARAEIPARQRNGAAKRPSRGAKATRPATANGARRSRSRPSSARRSARAHRGVAGARS